jgi:hypothetical protein
MSEPTVLLTQQGRAVAVAGLWERRRQWTGLTIEDNASLPAGSPMVFRCIGCGAPLIEREGYITRRQCCAECQALVDLGWME